MIFRNLENAKKALYSKIYNEDKIFEISKENNLYEINTKEIYDKYDYSDWIRGKKTYDEDEDYRRRIGVSDWDTPRVPSPDVAERARQAIEELKKKQAEDQKRLDEERQKREAAERKRLEEEARKKAEEERLRLEAEEKRRKQEEQILDDDRTLRDIS